MGDVSDDVGLLPLADPAWILFLVFNPLIRFLGLCIQ